MRYFALYCGLALLLAGCSTMEATMNSLNPFG
jgi:hypothetical protein